MNPEYVQWLCLALAAGGAIGDIATRKLPNWLCLALLLAAAAYSWLDGGGAQLGSAALHAVIALVIGMILFRIGFIGGGDAKFYTGAAFAVPLGGAFTMLGWTSISGLVLLVAMVVLRHLRGIPLRQAGDGKGFSVPYGVAIASGLAATLLL